jgi:putative adenine specific DNA methyltransferase|nr:MAG TPA: adenine specific DNA methyltransferase [Caudoviricetes sp.]
MCGVQGFNNNADHYDETFEPIRAYMEHEAKKVGLTSKLLTEITGVQMYGHWFTKSQFGIIPENHYKKLQEYYNGEAFEMPYNKLQKLLCAEQHATLKETVMAKRAYFDGTATQCIDVWVSDVTSQKERETGGGHATPKPIALCARAIKSSSREGEIVLDIFGGSGSTLIACEQLNRKAYLMELVPKWCDVIIKRWETLTGQKAIKIN